MENRFRLRLRGKLNILLVNDMCFLLLYRGEFIVPSFAEIWPDLGKKKEEDSWGKKKIPMSMEYILQVSIML